jgi:DnaK suppressor protein
VSAKKTTTSDKGLIFGEIKPYKAKKTEEYMNEAQQEHFRNILELWRAQLLEKSNDTLNHIHDEATNLPDQNDRATLEEGFSIELRARDRERKLVQKIEKSLFELDKGKTSNYGFCESCGADIGIPRLEARPTADLCIDCKELDEIREKSMV